MDINITIFFQAAQFIIAYVFLYKFLFAPAYEILYKQELIEADLYKQIEQEHHVKNSLQKTYHQRQLALKVSLIDMIPADAVQSGCRKLETGSTLYHVEKIELSQAKVEKTENFIIDNLSQVLK